MQAIQVKDPAGGPAGLDFIELPIPTLTNPRDILVKVHAVALNPGDTKLRQISAPGVVPGLDGAGVVIAAGAEAKFVAGDEVMWGSSGELGRNGSNAQYELVDSRVAGRKPKNLSWEDAAAIPLVGLTVWEMFEEKFRIAPDVDNSKEILLVVNGAGGVGAMAIQLALKVFGIKRIIVTAGRPQTVDFVKRMGATDVISHRGDIGSQLQALGVQLSLALLNADTARYVNEIAPHIAPFGQIGSVVESAEPVPIHDQMLFFKSVSFHWRMPTKSIFKVDVEAQGVTISRLGQLVAEGTILSMVTKKEPLTVASIREGHQLQESGTVIGKLVFTMGDSLA